VWSRRPATLASRLGLRVPSATGLLGLAVLADCPDWRSWQHHEPLPLGFPPLASDILLTQVSNALGTTIEQPWWSGNHRSKRCLDYDAPPMLAEECTHHGVPETAGFTGNKSHILTGNGKWSGGKGWSSKGKGKGYQHNDQQAPYLQAPFP
jgi:hypothetical protein